MATKVNEGKRRVPKTVLRLPDLDQAKAAALNSSAQSILNEGRLAPHDLRRTCARLCHSAGGELEQIQFLLGW